MLSPHADSHYGGWERLNILEDPNEALTVMARFYNVRLYPRRISVRRAVPDLRNIPSSSQDLSTKASFFLRLEPPM